MNKQLLLDKIEELKKRVKELENKCDKKRPADGEKFHFLCGDGDVASYNAANREQLRKYIKQGNCFWGPDAKKAAEMYKLRLQAYASRYIPKKGELVYYWDFKAKRAISPLTKWDFEDLEGVYLRTEEECEAWGKKYQECFEYLYK